jgi:diaminopimelate epimerase
MKFDKMEGLGNDFLVTHLIAEEQIESIIKKVPLLCDRRSGVGGDGVIFVLPSKSADFKMRIINSDGSEAEMCGNGIRCFTLYVRAHNLTYANKMSIETLAGLMHTEVLAGRDIKVTMSAPCLEGTKIPLNFKSGKVLMQDLPIENNVFKITAVSMGNPHVVIYADDLTDELVLGYGPKIEVHPLFPKKTNVEFVNVLSESEIKMRVWERGCGETQACGTGACASVVSGIVNKLHGNSVTVHLPGGDLFIEWSGNEADPVYMTGTARKAFSGEVDL